MQQVYQQLKEAEPQAKPCSSSALAGKSLLATFLFISIIISAGYLLHGSDLPPIFQPKDNVSEAQQREREAAFEALGPLPVAIVPEQEIANAVDTMQLAPDAKQSLLADLAVPEHKLRLIWIKLWDSNVEDGDTVQISSQGYARIIPLKLEPVVYAIPVHDNGIITFTGVHDGDGRGITVGLSSRNLTAVLPVMKEGRVLGLTAQVN